MLLCVLATVGAVGLEDLACHASESELKVYLGGEHWLRAIEVRKHRRGKSVCGPSNIALLQANCNALWRGFLTTSKRMRRGWMEKKPDARKFRAHAPRWLHVLQGKLCRGIDKLEDGEGREKKKRIEWQHGERQSTRRVRERQRGEQGEFTAGVGKGSRK